LKGNAENILSDLVLMKSTSDDDQKPIVDYVSQYLRRLGLRPRYLGDAAHPAILTQHRTGGVMLSGHLDTVPHGDGWTREDGDVEGGVIYGRGACDMKGGCTAMLMAAEALVAGNVPFSVCFTTDEETTMHGAAAAARSKIVEKAAAVVVAEPSNFNIVIKEKGLLQFSLSTTGRAAHASMPELGDNAIAKMTSVLHRFKELQRVPDDTLKRMTLSVNTIKGGTRINVIPSACSAEIDVRYPPPMTAESVLGLVRNKIGSRGYQLSVLHQLDPVETNPKSRAVKKLQAIIGPTAKLETVPYATEIVMFRRGNPRVMVCGPGDPKGCHIADEKVDLSSVVRAAELYTEYCSRMSGA